MILNRPHPEKRPHEFFIGHSGSEADVANYKWRRTRIGTPHKGKFPVFVHKAEMLEDGWTFDTASGHAISPEDRKLIAAREYQDISVYDPDTDEYAKLEGDIGDIVITL